MMFTFLILQRIFKKVGLALAGALLLAVCSTVWNQMIIAKLYSMNFLLCIWVYYICVVIRDHFVEADHKLGAKAGIKSEDESIGDLPKSFLYLGVVSGLSLANHWPIFILNSPGYLCFFEKRWLRVKNLLSFLVGLSVGVIPYLIMYWRSQTDPEVAFLGPLKDIPDLIHYVARSYYSTTDVSVLHTSHDILMFFTNFLRSFWLRDYIFVTVPLAAIGAYQLFRSGRYRVAFSLLPVFLSTTFTLLFLLRLEYNDLDENIQRVYWLVPFFAYAVWVTAGANWLESKRRYTGVAALAACALIQLVMYYPKNNMRDDDFAEAYARAALSDIPPGSDLIVSTDSDVGPTAVTNLILGVNPTVKLYTGSSVFFKNRMFDPRVMGYEERVKATTDFIKSEKRVYAFKGIEVLESQKNLPFQIIFNGLNYRYSAVTEPEPVVSQETIDLAKKALDSYVRSYNIDNWFYHRGVLAARLCNLLVLKGVEEHPAFNVSPECMQVLARHYSATQRRKQGDEMFMKWWNAKRHPIVTEKQQYLFHFLINRLELVNSMGGQTERQIQLLREGIEIASTSLYDYPLCDNKIAPLIKSISGPIQLSPELTERLRLFDRCKNGDDKGRVDIAN